jgi:hypothetical protein
MAERNIDSKAAAAINSMVAHLTMDPIHSTRWLRERPGNRATRAIIDGLTQAFCA